MIGNLEEANERIRALERALKQATDALAAIEEHADWLHSKEPPGPSAFMGISEQAWRPLQMLEIDGFYQKE